MVSQAADPSAAGAPCTVCQVLPKAILPAAGQEAPNERRRGSQPSEEQRRDFPQAQDSQPGSPLPL